jgi:proline iminopeptidase
MVKILMAGVVALATLLVAPAFSQASGDIYEPGRAIVADIEKIVTPHGVQETFEVTLGGARQVVNVRGSDRSNPLLIFVHGGPGAVEMPMAWSFQRPWEDFFTVVQWDQRGAGRSFPLNDTVELAPTLKPERYRDDAIELIELLKQKYHQPKVFLLGHSWGSVVGLAVAIKRPDLLYAYVGMGQVIDFRENEVIGFDWTLKRAEAEGNAEAIQELKAIEPYPGDGAFDAEKMTIERKWSVHYGALAAARSDVDFYYHAPRLSPEYTAADRKAWDDGSAFTISTMFSQLADLSYKSVHHLDVPVVMFLGRHDYTAPASITAQWMEQLTAPSKAIVWFGNSAHLMMLEEPGHTFQALLEAVRPLASRTDKAPVRHAKTAKAHPT